MGDGVLSASVKIEDFADQLIAERRAELEAWIRNLPALPLNTKLVEMNVSFDDGTEVEIDLHVTVEIAPKPEAPAVPQHAHASRFPWGDFGIAVMIVGSFALGVIAEYAARTR
jgi:hypothetical protein